MVTVTSTGVLRAIAEGTAAVTATVQGVVSAPVLVTVNLSFASLQSGDRRDCLSAPVGVQRIFTIDVPAGVGELLVGTGGGTGDLDLFLRFGEPPTNDFEDDGQFNSGRPFTEESIEVPNPEAGEWFLLVDSFVDSDTGDGPGYTDASLTVSTRSGDVGFDIDFLFFTSAAGAFTQTQADIIVAASAQFSAALPANLLGLWINHTDGQCVGNLDWQDLTDDLLVFVGIADIDGAGAVLAQAGPCLIRTAATPQPNLPIMSVMIFDVGRSRRSRNVWPTGQYRLARAWTRARVRDVMGNHGTTAHPGCCRRWWDRSHLCRTSWDASVRRRWWHDLWGPQGPT